MEGTFDSLHMCEFFSMLYCTPGSPPGSEEAHKVSTLRREPLQKLTVWRNFILSGELREDFRGGHIQTRLEREKKSIV